MPQRNRLILFILTLGFFLVIALTFLHVRQRPLTSLLPQTSDQAPSHASPPVLPPPPAEDELTFPGYDGDTLCPTSAPWLSSLKIERPFKYARRDIIVRPVQGLKRKSLTETSSTLLPIFQTIKEGDDAPSLSKCLDPLILDVPAYPPRYPNASHLLFGLATTLKRLEDSLSYLERWLPHTQARLIIIVNGGAKDKEGKEIEDSPGDPAAMKEMERRLWDLGIPATLITSYKDDDWMPVRYFSLLNKLYDYRDAGTRWAVIMDDDTFFPNLPSILSLLEKYNPNEEIYLGGMSEEWWSVVVYQFMALGGAGIILSIPLLQRLYPHYHQCIKNSGASAGDIRIYECIKQFSSTRLTSIEGMYQTDLHGDRSGLFECGKQFRSLHHWKQGWWDEGMLGTPRPKGNWYPIDSMHLVADICGSECFLGRWLFSGERDGDTLFSNHDTVLANGYSISLYPTHSLRHLPKHRGLEKCEQTWQGAGIVGSDPENRSLTQGWEHSLGIVRPGLRLPGQEDEPDNEEDEGEEIDGYNGGPHGVGGGTTKETQRAGKDVEKIQYRFLHAEKSMGGVRQWYHRFGDKKNVAQREEEGLEKELDEIIELFWIREDVWSKGQESKGGNGG